MKVDAIQSNQQGFRAKFLPSDAFKEMLTHCNDVDKKTIRAAKRFARKNKGHELLIDRFEVSKEGYYAATVKNADTGFNWNFFYRCNKDDYKTFSLRQFLKDVTNCKWLYSLDKKVQIKRALLTGK